MLYRCLQNHYATKMPYQSENCVIHGYKFTDDYYDDDAFDFSIGTMGTIQSFILSQRLRMKMN